VHYTNVVSLRYTILQQRPGVQGSGPPSHSHSDAD